MIQDDILVEIRDNFFKNKNPLSHYVIYARMRQRGNTDKSTRSGLSNLLFSGKIRDVGTGFIPILASEEKYLREEKSQKGMEVTIERVRQCIDYFYKKNIRFPTPKEIEDEFYLLFGKPNQKAFDRVLRFFAEDGLLLRTDDHKYYYRKPGYSENNLKGYMI